MRKRWQVTVYRPWRDEQRQAIERVAPGLGGPLDRRPFGQYRFKAIANLVAFIFDVANSPRSAAVVERLPKETS